MLLALSTASHSPEAEEVLQEEGAGALQGQDVAGPLCTLCVLLSKYEHPRAGQRMVIPPSLERAAALSPAEQGDWCWPTSPGPGHAGGIQLPPMARGQKPAGRWL